MIGTGEAGRLQSFFMNVVLLSAPGLNTHWLGPFGNEWVSTPALDRLACDAILFDQHFATEPTPTGHAVWLQQLVSILNLQPHAQLHSVLLDDRRHRCDLGLRYSHHRPIDYAAFASHAEARVAAFEDTIKLLPQQCPWFLHIETDRMLPPWDAESETYLDYAQNVGGFAEGSESAANLAEQPWNEPPFGVCGSLADHEWHRLRHTYATTLAGFDAEIEILLEILQEFAFDENTAFLFTSGYGLALGEHETIGPTTSAPNEAFTHVPLLVRLPKGEYGNTRINCITQSNDIPPFVSALFGRPTADVTILDVVRNGTPIRTHGRSVVHTAAGPFWALRDARYVFIQPPQAEPLLFEKPDDRWEVCDLSRSQPGPCDEFTALLNAAKEESI